MIVFNDIICFDKDELDALCSKIRGEAYDDFTRVTAITISNYLEEAFNYDTKLTVMIHEKIDKDIYPVVKIQCHEFANLNEIQFSLVAKDENRKITKREELEFNEYCDICFGHFTGLYTRLELNLRDYV